MVSWLRKMFNFASARGWEGKNPATGIERFKEASGERFLSPEELKRFLTALSGKTEQLWRDFFLMLLFTGARRSNVQAMAWEDVSIDRGLWRIPNEESKSGEPLLVVLPPPAVAILKRRAKDANGSDWVFASTGKTGHVTEPKKAWNELLTRAKIDDFRLHDLRRTLGSWLACAGVSLPIIGKALGHKSQAATQVYARLDKMPVREAVTTTTTAMLTASRVDLDKLTGTKKKRT